jgi:rhamnosyltransferase
MPTLPASKPAAAPPRTCAIVVTYRPGRDVWDNLQALRVQVDRLVIVDNASDAASAGLLAGFAGDPGVEVVANGENRGIATALNQGARRARAEGFEWIATFDQDSRVPPGYFATLFAAWRSAPQRARIAVLASAYRDRGLGVVSSPSEPMSPDDTRNVFVPVTATSGNVVWLPALDAVGGFAEEYFIDLVDFEFCLRLRARGWRVLEVRSVRLDHAQGAWERRRFLWRRPAMNDYGEMRRYYQARNRLALYGRHGAANFEWCAHDARGYAWDCAKLLLFGTRRRAKLAAMARGAVDGLFRRMGPRTA